jgi:hypothetical protein
MNSSLIASGVRFDSDKFSVYLSDGRVISVPFAWFPRLLRGAKEQRENVRVSSRGLHWDALDEDVSIEALIAGRGDQTRTNETFAPTRAAFPLAGWVPGITPDDVLPPGHWMIVSDSSARYLEALHEQCRTLVAGRPIA